MKNVGDVAPPRSNLGPLTLSSRGGGCKYVLECLTVTAKTATPSVDSSSDLNAQVDCLEMSRSDDRVPLEVYAFV